MIVISDLIGTLTTGSPVLGLVDWVRHNQSRLRANWYMLTVMPSYVLAKRGLLNWQTWTQRLMVTSMPLIRDATPANVRLMAEWSVERELWPKRRQDVLDRFARYRENGAQIVIASSVFEPTVTAFGRRIGAEAIGTPVEIAGGCLRFAADVVASQRKIERVLNELGVKRVDAAYGDTQADIPLLEHADRPVAVYPDDLLRTTALERGWEIIGGDDPN